MATSASTNTQHTRGDNARWTRLIPIAILVYIISFMDRTNIGFAFSGIGKSLHIGKAEEGLAGGIFFIGYLFLQIPGGHLSLPHRRARVVALRGGSPIGGVVGLAGRARVYRDHPRGRAAQRASSGRV